ncbi:DUF4097 family beta strand repeat-containing protein [Georgenia ruanii]|uniref:DUF4097 family beta strand repeat protein n=1 Tax=Georgenia ruanii TaxID=348442 RepID=A0A7J9UY63_9MICO|nr:DUF4097 family beta strand repeat-containing protein [Georgenia ruanii]MPV89565.1 DUF4097 family beta strand repeat protein [Georgenia ruanii]
MHQAFPTPGPVELYVELGAGRLTVRAGEVTETAVTVEGRDADQVSVDHHGNQVTILAPRRWMDLLGAFRDLAVTVDLPAGSTLASKLGSGDLRATGPLGPTRVRNGSGSVRLAELRGSAVVESGSGEITIGAALGDLRVRSGSGDVRVERTGGSVGIVTASGDVVLGETDGDVVARTASGEINLRDARSDARLTTASGDITVAAVHRGEIRAKAVSGDVRVGVPRGIPVWTDVSSISGKVVSTLEGAGRPAEGQDFITVRASTVSGGVYLDQLT